MSSKIEAIIIAYICDDPRIAEFSQNSLAEFKEKYHPLYNLKIGRTPIFVGRALYFQFARGQASFVIAEMKINEYSFQTHVRGYAIRVELDDAVYIEGKRSELELPREAELPKFPRKLIRQMDPTGEFGMMRKFRRFIGPPQRFENYLIYLTIGVTMQPYLEDDNECRCC